MVCKKIWTRDVVDLEWATICLRRYDAALPAIERRRAHAGVPRSPTVKLTKQSQTEKANEFNAAVTKGVCGGVRVCFMAEPPHALGWQNQPRNLNDFNTRPDPSTSALPLRPQML
jgi:hypothetical protein